MEQLEQMNDLDTDLHDNTDHAFSPHFRRSAPDEEFDRALADRSLIDVAVGITMRSNDCTREIALAHLCRVARTFDITVVQLARGLIETSGKRT